MRTTTFPMYGARLTLFAALALCGACGSGDIELEGEYTATGVWDLSAPVGPDGVGGAVADLVIEQATAAAVPGFLEDDAISVTSHLIRGPIVDALESQLPEDLRKDGPVLTKIRSALARVEVQSRLTFTDDVEGTEAIERLRFDPEGLNILLDATLLPTGVTASAELDGDRKERNRVELDPYTLQLHFGELILLLLPRVLDGELSDALSRLEAAIACDVIFDAVTNEEGNLQFDVAGKSFEISGDTLQSACDWARDEVLKRAFSAASLDSGIEIGGPLTLIDEDLDGRADVLSTDQEFEGRFTLLPRPLDLPFDPSFIATRR